MQNISVNDSDGTSPVIGSGGSLNAILRFNAYADNDQMPIVRMAIDWGDGEPYVMQGWFKNRKTLCGAKVCSGDLNVVCNNDNDCGSNKPCKKESHFGDSPEACEEGFYQFTHIYECNKPAGQKCTFTPRVQVLDNWGWCNGTCNTNNVSGGCWDDPAKLEATPPKPEDQSCSIENTTNKDKHWTPFGGTIEITP